MNKELHVRAEQLIAQERLEGISAADHRWLRQHLAECPSCASRSAATEQAIHSLRGVSITVPPALASRAQFRVRLRSMELREREPKRRALWVMCGLSWVFGIASAPYVWRVFEWFGQFTGVPKLVWEIGFGLWWTIPALFAAIVLLLENAHQSAEPDWIKQGS